MIGGMWGYAAIGLLAGIIPGLLLFPWLASPFNLIPYFSKIAAPFTRVFLTVSQFIRGAGVLVKRSNGSYEIGTYLPDKEVVQLSDRTMALDAEQTRWGLFGKKAFGVTWESGTDLHNRIARDEATDGGELAIDMGAAHRAMEGSNDADAISRTEEKAKAEHGGGDETLGDKAMVGLLILMVLLGSFTSWFMLGGMG